MARCEIPKAPDESPSTLYLNLQTLCNKDHALANYVYAKYKANNLVEAMNAAGYKVDKHGEHKAKDVYEFLNIKEIQNEAKLDNITAGKKAGAIDSNGNFIEYNSAKEALEKAKQFNEQSKGKIAYVIQNDDKFGIIVDKLDARTQYLKLETETSLRLWNQFTDVLINEGIDIQELENLNKNSNALNLKSFIDYINNVSFVNNKILNLKDIKALVVLNPNNKLLQNAFGRWGDIDIVCQKIYKNLQSTRQHPFIINLLESLRSSYIINSVIPQLKSQLLQEKTNILQNREEISIKEELSRLQLEYGIGVNDIILENKEIESLSEAVSKAIVTLQRQLRFIQDKEGRTQQGIEIEENMQTIINELQSKRSCTGLLNFLSNALNYAQLVNDKLNNIPEQSNTLDYIRQISDILATAQNMQESYYSIINALADIDTVGLIIDQNITEADKVQIQQNAAQVRDILKKQNKIIRSLQKSTMLNIVTYVIGDKSYDGFNAANLVSMVTEDSTYMDFLYSSSRVSNPMIATLGTIIRNAQNDRQVKMNEISLRIRRINDKLRTSGNSDTSFMFIKPSDYEIKPSGYNEDYRIISEEGIDWAKFNKEKNKAKTLFKSQGLNGFVLKQAMEEWEENNTQLKLVDKVNNRYERIPNLNYHNLNIKQRTWDILTDAQKEYYNDMMQLKAELNSLLPYYAQDQYRPVQLRGTILDLLKSGIDKKLNAKTIAKSILNRMNFFKVKQDDEFFAQNGEIISGELYGITQSDIKNTILRRIPIYYFNKVNQTDLLQNFSSGMSRLAGTAINYDCLNQVKSIVELMADFIESQNIDESKKGYSKYVDKANAETINIYQRIFKNSKSNRNSSLVRGFISTYLYNEQAKKDPTKFNIFIRNLISYNSLKSLSLNVKGGVSNYLVGEYQLLIKALAGTLSKGFKTQAEFTLADYIKAKTILFGDMTLRVPGKIMDYFTNNKNSKDKLLIDLFDPIVDSFGELSHKNYYSNPFRIMFGSFNAYGLYSSGEGLIHITTMYAKLFNEKVYNKDGKKISLYEALKVSNKQDGNSEIVIDDGITIDGTNPVTKEYLMELKSKIRNINQNCHGSMAEEDKGMIHNFALGSLVMNFRQWMVESYSRRYRGMHWDASVNDFREGYLVSIGKLITAIAADYLRLGKDIGTRWKDMTDSQKQNVVEAMSAISLFTVLFLLDFTIGDIKGIKGNDTEKWIKRFSLYQLKRLLLDERAFSPTGIVTTGKTMLNSPIPAINTVNGLLYPIVGLTNKDIDETIKSGYYKGWNKYVRNLLKYTVPYWYQIEQLKRMNTDDDQFLIFDSGQMFR